jgi:hypothetical protein
LDPPAARLEFGVDDRASLVFRMEWRPCHSGHFSEASDCFTTSNSQSLCYRADTLEDVSVATALGEAEEARKRIEEVPPQHPFDLRYARDLPQTAWERCEQVLDQYDVKRLLRRPW